MSKFTAFVIIVALRIVYHPSQAEPVVASSAGISLHPSPSEQKTPVKYIRLTGSISNRLVFPDNVDCENIVAGKFEEEQSNPVITMTGTSLVFINANK